MGQSFRVVNLDTYDGLNQSAKLMEMGYIGDIELVTMGELMLPGNDWYNTRVCLVGSYCKSHRDPNERALRRQVFAEMHEDSLTTIKRRLKKESWRSRFRSLDLYALFVCLPYRESSGTNKEVRYFINHTKNEYVDIAKCPVHEDLGAIHPVALLTAIGNEYGAGGYRADKSKELIGRWAGDKLSSRTEFDVEDAYILLNYAELIPDFLED